MSENTPTEREAYRVVIGSDASNPNNRRLIVNESQWAKVYGFDAEMVEARAEIIAAALRGEGEANAPAPDAGWLDELDGDLQQIAASCSMDMTLWDRFSNGALRLIALARQAPAPGEGERP